MGSIFSWCFGSSKKIDVLSQVKYTGTFGEEWEDSDSPLGESGKFLGGDVQAVWKGISQIVEVTQVLSGSEVELEVERPGPNGGIIVRTLVKCHLSGLERPTGGPRRSKKAREVLYKKIESYGHRVYGVLGNEDSGGFIEVELYSPEGPEEGDSVNLYMLGYEDPILGPLVEQECY